MKKHGKHGKLLIENITTFLENEEDQNNQKVKTKDSKDFDAKKLVPLAMKWLSKKFPKERYGFEFKYKEHLVGDLKSYAVSIDGEEFEISGKAFDTNSNGTKDTVLFRINPVEEAPEKEEPFDD